MIPLSMHSSLTHISPLVIGNRPAMQLRAVDFPQPEGPRKVTNSPFSTVRLKLFRASFSENRLIKFLMVNCFNSLIVITNHDFFLKKGRLNIVPSCYAILRYLNYFLIFAPTSLSHMSQAVVRASASSWVVDGYLVIASSRYLRIAALILVCLSAGAIVIGTFLIAGPG